MPSLRLAAALMVTAVSAGCGGGGPGSTDNSGTNPNGELACPGAGGTVEGVDVSEFQGNVDWPTVKASGRGFAIARVADGTGHLDPTFDANWSGIAAAGMVRGVYQFFRPEEDGTAQANVLLSKVAAFKPGDLPPVLDVEVTDGQSAATFNANIAAWVAQIHAVTGLTPIVYTAPGFWDGLGGAQFGAETLWVADWGVSCPDTPSPWKAWSLWQYADDGHVAGIGGTVDLDQWNGGAASLAAFAQGAAAPPPPSLYYRGMATDKTGQGYWIVGSDGGIFTYGDAVFDGSLGGKKLNAPIVGMASTPDGKGYWLTGSDGGVFTFGDAAFHGSAGSTKLNAAMVGMAATPSGNGYWLLGADGGVFAYGDAGFHGSAGSMKLNAAMVGMAPTPSGGGYWLVGADGGVFAYGDAGFYGSTGSMKLNAPIVAMAATPTGKGYWLVGSDGGVFAYGDAPFLGSTGSVTLSAPVVGIAATPDGKGYWLVAGDGGIFTYGDAGFFGSRG